MTLLLNGVTPPLYQNIPPRRLFLSRSCCCLVSSSRSTALLLPDCPRLPATMSVVWLAVFATLCVELVFTAVLVAPLPIVIRNGIARFIYHHKIGDKLSFFLRFATLALMFAVWDSVQVRWGCVRLGYGVLCHLSRRPTLAGGLALCSLACCLSCVLLRW